MLPEATFREMQRMIRLFMARKNRNVEPLGNVDLKKCIPYRYTQAHVHVCLNHQVICHVDDKL